MRLKNKVAIVAGAGSGFGEAIARRYAEEGARVVRSTLASHGGLDKIRVNVLNPVIGETGLLEMFMGMPDTPQNRQIFVASIPLGRLSKPLDIANAALFLASDEAEFITGACFEVNAGRCV